MKMKNGLISKIGKFVSPFLFFGIGFAMSSCTPNMPQNFGNTQSYNSNTVYFNPEIIQESEPEGKQIGYEVTPLFDFNPSVKYHLKGLLVNGEYFTKRNSSEWKVYEQRFQDIVKKLEKGHEEIKAGR